MVDPEVLLKDIKIYLLSVVRLANSPVLPYNYGRTVAEILEEINNYQRAAQGKFDFSPLQQEAQALLAETQKLGQYQQKLQGPWTARRYRKSTGSCWNCPASSPPQLYPGERFAMIRPWKTRPA